MKDHQRLHTSYLLLASALAIAFSCWRLVTVGDGMPIEPGVALLLLVVGFVVRSASFRLNGWVVISLDTTVFVASLFILGTRGAGVVLVVVTGATLAWSHLIRPTSGSRRQGAMITLFVTSASLASLLLVAWGLDIETLVRGAEGLRVAREAVPPAGVALAEGMAWKLGLFAGGFLMVQYAVVLPRHWLAGRSAKALFLQVFLPGMGVEVALLPLAYLVVFTYHRSLLPSLSGANPGFLLILVTYAGVVIGIRFLARYGEQVRQRLQEMERLNRFHSKISASLQLNLLSEMVTDTLLDTFSSVDGAAVVLQRENLVRVRGRTEEARQRIEFEVREYLKRRDDSRSGSVVFLPLAPEARGGGLLGFYCDPSTHRSFNKGDLRLFRLLVNIVDVAVQNARLYEIATIDGLTGLYVRRYFEQRLTEEFIRSGRYGENFTLVLVDLNYFKQINDVYGHIVGDRILKAVGEVLRDSVRSMDVPARYGGDEFAILLPRASREDAELIRERIEEGIERCVVDVNHVLVGVSAASGMASYLTDRPADPTEMILKADDRLYEAKKNRRQPLGGPAAGEVASPVS